MKKHIRIIHPTVDAVRKSEDFRHLESAELKISCVGLDRGPATLASQFEVALAVPDTCVRAIEAEKEGADAIVIDCMGDVGVAEARECVSIPVLGPYETSLHIASLLSRRFGIVTMVDAVIGIMESYAKNYGAADRLGSIRAIGMSVAEMLANPRERDERLVAVSRQLIQEDRVDALILGCAEMQGAEHAITTALRAENINVPVIEPVTVTIFLAAAIVEAGLSHGKQSYPMPGADRIIGYDNLRGLMKITGTRGILERGK